MTLTVSTPFKSGTLASIGTGANGANTRINTSGISWAAGDVGRHVYFYTGNAAYESRLIIGQGTNYCDVEYAFGTFPILDQDGNDTLSNAPSNGNSVGVSYRFDDIDNGVDLIKESDRTYRQVPGQNIVIGSQVMLHDTEKNLELNGRRFDLDGALQLGDLDEGGFVKGACSIIDISEDTGSGNAFGGFNGSGNIVSGSFDLGGFRIYGGTYTSAFGHRLFLRIYNTGSAPSVCHLVDVLISGSFGGRIGNDDRAIVRNIVASEMENTVGVITTIAPTGLIQGIRVNSGVEVLYYSWNNSFSATIQNVRFNTTPGKITSHICTFQNSAGVTGNTATFKDIVIADVEAVQASGTSFGEYSHVGVNNNVFIFNFLDVEVRDTTQSLVPGYTMRITDNGSSQSFLGTSGTGAFDRQELEYGRYNQSGDTAGSNFEISDFTLKAPYTVVLRKYEKAQYTAPYDAKGDDSGRTLITVPDTVDASIVEATEATVAAYTSLSNLDRLRDRWKYETVQDFLLSDIGAGGGAVTIDGYDLILSASASPAFNEASGTVTVNTGSILSAGSEYTNLIIPAGQDLTISAGVTVGCALTLTGGVAAADVDQLTGILTMSGGSVLTLSAPGALPSGTAGASTKIVVDSAASGDTYDATGFTFDASTVFENTSGQPINVALNTGQQEPTKLETSGTITFTTPVVSIDVTAPNLLDGSRVRLYNSTQSSEIANVVVSGGAGFSTTLTEGTEYDSGDTIILLATYQSGGVAKNVFRGSAVASTADVSFADSQTDWTAHNTAAIDGSTVSECSTDFANIEVDVIDADNSTSKSRIAAFIVDALTDADGIRNWVSLGGVPIINYSNASNAVIDASVAALTINNSKAASKLTVTDSFSLKWSDDLLRVDAILGSSIVFSNPSEVFNIETGTSGLTAAESSKLFSLDTSEVDANIVKVNSVSIQGAGTETDPFGP